MVCAVPHDDPVHSTTAVYPAAQHSVVDGHDILGYDSGGPNVDVTAVPLSVPFTPLGAGMVAVLYKVGCVGVAVACQSAKALGAIITTSASASQKHTKIGYSFIFLMLKPP